VKDLLRTNLTDLADRARPVDLLPRVHATSRKLRRRAAAITVAATAVVVVAAVGGTAMGLASGPHHHAPTTRVTGTPSPGTPTPTTPTPARSNAAAADPPAPATTIPGTVYYSQDAFGDGAGGGLAKSTVYTLTGGALHTMHWTLGDADHDYMVSPDGRALARVVDNGDLTVERAGDHVARTVVPGANAGTPIWSPDGSRILYTRTVAGAGSAVWVVDADGSHNHLVSGDNARGPVWSGDGSRIAYRSDGSLVTVNADGTGRHAVSSGRAGTRVDGVTSLSSDGSRAVVDLESGQCGCASGWRSTYLSNGVLMDTRTGEVLAWPVRGRFAGALFTPGDGLLLRVTDGTDVRGPYRLVLVSAGGTVLAKQAEPAPPKGQLYELMGYRPAAGK
jgi:WD40-like Beta Propeller Repeat